ncbi:MAG: phenylalanine--tRNA ligase subunit alpha [Ignavibacteria bacterium]|nr:phenylalanine--tRNA ligase subunit alpha [Ignavibacteria bacterium]
MIETIQQLRTVIEQDLAMIHDAASLETFRLKHLVKKGTLQELVDQLRTIPKEEKPAIGKVLNELRQFVESSIASAKESIEHQHSGIETIDVTLPGLLPAIGHVHPIRQTLDRIVDIFAGMGFSVAEGIDIEDDYHNYEALNFPADHPARDMQDTFFIDDAAGDVMLRSHTSPVQIRMMKYHAPPIRSIMPGRVYRNEAVTARSLAEFHQVEGLYIDKGVTFADLKGTITSFAKQMYGESLIFKFRPSYFPFTEPSAEVDINCYLCSGKGCKVCKHSGWLEICGCGMVHPNVLRNCGIDPDIYSGFAFGFGIERVTMLATGIDDIRALYENDMRVLRQF